MDLKTVIDTAPTLKKPRRTFTAEFKHQLIQQCQQPDTSVAKVAMQHQINANLLHKWIRQSRSMPPALKTPSIPQTDFLPVILHPTPASPSHAHRERVASFPHEVGLATVIDVPTFLEGV